MRFNAIGVGLVLLASMTLAGCAEKKDGAAAIIDMKNFVYEPAEKTVAKGTKVTWMNRDGVGHTVTSNGTGPLNSGNIPAGQSYSYTFTEAGTYDYYCEPHSSGTGMRTGMVGKIIVTA